MKAIVDRVVYDTEKAEEITSWSNGLGRSDFRNCEETLYRTKAGRWFLHGDGGAMTRYSQPVGNNGSTAGEKIIPMTEDEVIEWCEERECYKTLERHFQDKLTEA